MKTSRNLILAGSGVALAAALGISARRWAKERNKTLWARMFDQGCQIMETSRFGVMRAFGRTRRRIRVARYLFAVGRRVF